MGLGFTGLAEGGHRLSPGLQFGLYYLAVLDRQPLPDRLIHQLPNHRRRSPVGVRSVAQKLQGFIERSKYFFAVALGDGLPFINIALFFADAGLLERQHVVVHQSSVAELKQMGLFFLELCHSLLSTRDLALGCSNLDVDVLLDRSADCRGLFGAEEGSAEVLLDYGDLDSCTSGVGRVAVVSHVEAPEAAEVLVGPSVAFGFDVKHPAATLAAEQRALEVVIVDPGPDVALRSGLEQVLNTLERVRIN